MRFRKLDLNLLVALDALLSEVNVTRAAKRMHITQSAMSAALGRLRDHFGDPILVPSGRGMQCTRLGEDLRAPLADLVARIDALVSTSRSFNPATSADTLCVAFANYPAAGLFGRVVRMAKERAPHLRFECRRLDLSADEVMADPSIDLVCVPEGLRSAAMPSQALDTQAWVCLSLNRLGPLSLAQFSESQHVAFPGAASVLRSDWAKSLGALAFDPKLDVVTTDLGVAVQLVQPDGLLLVPSALQAEASALNPALHRVNLGFELPTMRLVMQWRDYDQMDPSIIWLRDLMLESVSANR